MGRTAISTRELTRAGVLARVAAGTLSFGSAAVMMEVSYRHDHRHIPHLARSASTELRVKGVTADAMAEAFLREAANVPIRIIANRPDTGLPEEYSRKLRDAQSLTTCPDARVLFVEVQPSDASLFSEVLVVQGATVGGHRVLRCASPAIPNAIAALLLFIRDQTRNVPHAYFGWTEGNPIVYLLKFLAFGEGDTAPVTREVLRQAEPDPDLRPRIHVG